LQELLDTYQDVFLCPVVYQEVLQGIRDDHSFEVIRSRIRAFPLINTDIMQATDYAISMYRTLQKQGITIRKAADCLIASYAILGDMDILHDDKDFDAIALEYPLRVVSGS
jgi:predicted nucleic acid-binding protein